MRSFRRDTPLTEAARANDISDSWFQPGPVGPPPDAPLPQYMRDTINAANRKPGSAPMPSLFAADGSMRDQPGEPPAPRVNPADLRQPKDGDWADHNRFVAKQQDERKRKNLEGATFVDGGGAATPGAFGGAPVLVDKGGRRAQGWQIHEGLDLGPQASEALASGDERGRAAAGLDYMAGRQAAEYERGYLERHAQASEKFAAEEASRAEKYAAITDEHMSKLDGLRSQIREAKVDPFGGMNEGLARVGQAIAIGLGAFASKRGENAGLDAVKNTISQNIQKQEQDVAKLERGARGEVNFLAQLKQQYGDISVAREAARIAYLEQAKVELAKNLGDPEVADPRLLAGYERMQAELDKELVDRTAKFKAITEDRVVRHDVNAQPRYVGAGFGHKADGDARYLSEAYEKAGVPQALANLEGVDQMIDAFGEGDIEGIGPFASMVPDKLYGFVGSDRGMANRQAVAAVKNRVRKSIAGASLTDGEKVELNKELEGAGDAASLRRALQSVRRSLHHQRQNIAAGASPEGNALYHLRGGSVRTVPLDKPTTPHVRGVK